MDLPIGATLKSLTHSTINSLPYLPKVAKQFVHCGIIPATVFMAGAHACSKYAEYAAGMDEQPYQTLMKVSGFVATFSLFHVTSHLMKSKWRPRLHAVFSLHFTVALVGVTRVYRDTIVEPEKRATWGNITVKSCPFIDYLSNGQELLQRIASKKFFAELSRRGAFKHNDRSVTLNFVEVTSSLCVTILPLAILTAMAVEHLFSLKRILTTGIGRKYLLQDLAMILPLIDYLGRHGIYLPLKDRGVTEGVDKGIAFTMNYTQNQGAFAKTWIVQWLQTKINLIKKYELSESILPILQLYYAPVILKVIFAIQLLDKHLPQEVSHQLWLALERSYCNMISTMISLMESNPHFGLLEEEMPNVVIKMRQMLRDMGLYTLNPILLFRLAKTRQTRTANVIGKHLTVKNAIPLSDEDNLEVARDSMRRGNCLSPSPVSAGAGQVFGQAVNVNPAQLIANTRSEVAQLIPEIIRKLSGLLQQDKWDDASINSVLETFLSDRVLDIIINNAREILTENTNVVLPPDLGLKHELLADPEAFFQVSLPEGSFDQIFKQTQKEVEKRENLPDWLRTSILEGKLKERLASASSSLPGKADELRAQATMFCHALCEQLKQGKRELLEYISNNSYITGTLIEARCSEQTEDLFKQLNLAAKAFLSNQEPHMVQFLLEAHGRREAKMHALIAQQAYLEAKCISAINDLIRVGEQTVSEGPPLSIHRLPPAFGDILSLVTSLTPVSFIASFVRMALGYAEQTTLDRATNLHSVNQAVKRFSAQNGESLFHTQMALELPTWVLDGLHGPAETLTYEKLLKAGLGKIFASELLPSTLTIDISTETPFPLYSPKDQMNILEAAIMLHQFELLIPELIKAEEIPKARIAYQKQLTQRADTMKVEIQKAINERQQELTAWKQSQDLLPKEVKQDLKLKQQYKEAQKNGDDAEINSIQPRLLITQLRVAMKNGNTVETNRLSPLLAQSRSVNKVPAWETESAQDSRQTKLKRALDDAMQALLPHADAPTVTTIPTRDVDLILEKLQQQSRIASCAAIFFRCARCHDRTSTWNQNDQKWGMPIFFHTLSGLDWCAYGHSQERLTQWQESEQEFALSVQKCSNHQVWSSENTTLATVSEHLLNYFSYVMSTWEQTNEKGSIQHVLMNKLVPLIAEHGMERVQQAISSSSQQEADSDDNYVLVQRKSSQMAIDDLDLRAKQEKVQQAVGLIATSLPANVTLKAIIDTLAKATTESGVNESLLNVSIEDLCCLHQAVKEAGRFWMAAFRIQYGEQQKIFNKHVGPTTMILLKLATPRRDKTPAPPENQTGFAVKNLGTTKTLSRKGVQAAPNLYKHLLTGEADKLFNFTPWQQMVAQLAPNHKIKQDIQQSSTSTTPEPMAVTLGKVAKAAPQLVAKVFKALRFNLLSKMDPIVNFKQQLDNMTPSALQQLATQSQDDLYEVKLSLSAEQVGYFIRELSSILSALPSSFRLLISDWTPMCALLAERYPAASVELTMQYNSTKQSLTLVSDPESQSVTHTFEPLQFEEESVTHTFKRLQFEKETANFVQQEAFRADGLEPPQLLGWADLCNMFYTFTGDKAWVQIRDASLHRIDTSKEDQKTLQAIDCLAKDGDLANLSALQADYSQLKGSLNTSSQALLVIKQCFSALAHIRHLWQTKSSFSKFLEQLNDWEK